MRIDKSNYKFINSKDIYIHDTILMDIVFDYNKKNLFIITIVPSHALRFHNVIGFEMTSCDFWQKSSRILDWEIETDNFVLIDKLFKQKEDNNEYTPRLNNKEDFIESIITLTSGDTLRIACEYIIFDEDDETKKEDFFLKKQNSLNSKS